ncbi:MAG TPA: SIMPL domain-containing protein [Woeseiaceae bacterium]|nr:SIMPL domain-containing protein [Woeseiaceae bacterium]
MKTFEPVRRQAALAATILVTAMALAACTDQHNTFAETRSITVTGEGEASGAPDQASVSAGVQILAESVIEATHENESIIGKIMEALDEQGIPPEKIQTSNYSIWAEQNYQEPGQNRISGYHVSNVVTVKIDDVDKLGDVLGAVVNAGANSIHGIQFGVKDTKALEQQAREAAMADARARAESLARLAGVQLGEVLSISTSYGGGPPRPMMSRSYDMAEAAAPSISPGQQSLSVQIHATFAIR